MRLVADDADHGRDDEHDDQLEPEASARILRASMAIVIASRFRGPETSGNGGYTCGVIAQELGGDEVEVTLRLPPPLDEALRLDDEGRVWDDHALIAEVRRVRGRALRRRIRLRGATRSPPSCRISTRRSRTASSAAPRAQRATGCGSSPGRSRGRTSSRRRGPCATTPSAPEFVWAALDCPGAYATGRDGRGTSSSSVG